jgi:sulfur relay protein TusC/DsrF
MQTSVANRFLYILRAAPYGGASGQEALDAILAALALELEVSVLLTEDAVFSIKAGQMASSRGIKQYTKTFAALEDLGLRAIYADEIALLARGLTETDLQLATQHLDSEGIKDLISQHDRVFVF